MKGLLAFAALWLLACSAAADAHAADPSDSEFAALAALDQRVADVSFRLNTSNTELCREHAPQSGLVLQHIQQYGPGIRAAAARHFGLGDAPVVLAVAKGSPAERAGLRAGDTLLSVNGLDLRAPSAVDAAASNRPVETAMAQLGSALSHGPALVDIQRAGLPLKLTLTSISGCAYLVQVTPSSKANASADGWTVIITSAFVRFAAGDDDLALVLGHEIAHNILGHRGHAKRRDEARADYVGLYLAARAGYAVSGAADFWRRYGADHRGALLGFISHPKPSERAASLALAAAEIATKETQGDRLLPNPPAGR